MSRPPKCRRVAFLPEATYFKPAGVPLRVLDEVLLSVEEAEAVRLKDLEGLAQAVGADKMNISRPTFQRVLASARRKIADALLNGRAVRIEGGNFEMAVGVPPLSAGSPGRGMGYRGRGRGRRGILRVEE
jgi:predicted DNA-binding protein (UPF0251 family)